MRKIYLQPKIMQNSVSLKTLCIGIQGSTHKTSGNLVKSRRKKVEDYEEFDNDDSILLILDNDNKAQNSLW